MLTIIIFLNNKPTLYGRDVGGRSRSAQNKAGGPGIYFPAWWISRNHPVYRMEGLWQELQVLLSWRKGLGGQCYCELNGNLCSEAICRWGGAPATPRPHLIPCASEPSTYPPRTQTSKCLRNVWWKPALKWRRNESCFHFIVDNCIQLTGGCACTSGVPGEAPLRELHQSCTSVTEKTPKEQHTQPKSIWLLKIVGFLG